MVVKLLLQNGYLASFLESRSQPVVEGMCNDPLIDDDLAAAIEIGIVFDLLKCRFKLEIKKTDLDLNPKLVNQLSVRRLKAGWSLEAADMLTLTLPWLT